MSSTDNVNGLTSQIWMRLDVRGASQIPLMTPSYLEAGNVSIPACALYGRQLGGDRISSRSRIEQQLRI